MRAVEEFRVRHGASPGAVASAPGRVNLIGEHLDYNGGLALPMPLQHRATVAVGPRADDRVSLSSLQQDGAVTATLGGPRTTGWAAYVVGVLESLRGIGVDVPGMDVVVDGRVPLGSGLSSSAALEVAVAMAAVELAGATGTVLREQLVEVCVRAENDYVGAPTGRMDQMAAALSSSGHALLVDFADLSHRAVPWSPPADLLVVDTGVRHSHAGGEYAVRRRECQEATDRLGRDHLVEAALEEVETLPDPLRARARHVVSEQHRVRGAVRALETGTWTEFGDLMLASHRSLRDDYAVSCPELDLVVDSAMAAGALGARMTGGGFGGCAIVLAPAGLESAVRERVEQGFAAAGLEGPTFLDGRVGDPARLELSPGP